LRILSLVINRRMTLPRKANDLFIRYSAEIKSRPYLIINIFFAGVILLIIAYSGIFSPDTNNYPVTCIHEKLTGIKCFSCGLSHSFSLIVRGRLQEAYQWNLYGIQVFIFFVSQLFMRIFFSVWYVKDEKNRSYLICYDIAGSVLVFSIAFYPFFRQLAVTVF
jgi:hypothetical protein